VRKRIIVLAVLVVLLAVSAYAQTTDLLELTKTGTPEDVQAAISNGADINARTNDGTTVLMLAARYNQNPEVVTTLLKAGADVNARAKDGSIALMYAARHNQNPEVITTLLNAGADLNAQSKAGNTALMLAARYNLNPEVTMRLLKAGADVHVVNSAGSSAIDYARENENLKNTDAYSQLQGETSEANTKPTSAVRSEDHRLVSIGVLASWAPLESLNQTVISSGVSTNIDFSYESLGAKAFVDFTYIEASIGFRAAVTQVTGTISAEGSSLSASTPFSESLIDIRLLGKYPFRFGTFTLFPLLGLAKDFCLSGSVNGVDFSSDDLSDFSPWYLMAGIRGDLNVSKQIYIRADLTAAYNLTSERSQSYYNNLGVTYSGSSGWQVQFEAGIGFSL